MNKFWSLIALVAVIITIFMFYGAYRDDALSTDQLANLGYYGILGTIACSSVLALDIKLSHTLRNGVIWVALFFGVMFGYNMRYEIQDFFSYTTAGIIPSSPFTRYTEDGTTVTVERAKNGHFDLRAVLNNKTILMTIDTGATSVVLNYEDAMHIGIDVNNLIFNIPVNTANGRTYTARTMIDSFKFGAIERKNVEALVSQPYDSSISLLGMNLLDRLSGYSVRGDRFTLID